MSILETARLPRRRGTGPGDERLDGGNVIDTVPQAAALPHGLDRLMREPGSLAAPECVPPLVELRQRAKAVAG